MTFEEWKSKKEWNTNTSQSLNPDNPDIFPGFEYPDGSVILLNYSKPGIWYTIVGRDEIEDKDLDKVEQFLWNEHSMYNFEPHIDTTEENEINKGYKLFCEQHGLNHLSMDEQHLELSIDELNAIEKLKKIREQIKELNLLMDRWTNMKSNRRTQVDK